MCVGIGIKLKSLLIKIEIVSVSVSFQLIDFDQSMEQVTGNVTAWFIFHSEIEVPKLN